MSCQKIRGELPGYVDGALRSAARAAVRRHLEACEGCRAELDQYRKLSQLMSRVERPVPPADLAVRIRVAVSEARNTESWVRRQRGRFALVFSNILQPLAVPATGGTLTSLLVFAVILQSLLAGVPLGAVPNDEPTNLLQPARLESLAHFPVNTSGNGSTSSEPLVIEATLNARGEVVDYEVLAGPDGRAIRRQLDQVLMFSRFRPQLSFGRPVYGGRVVLSFSEVRVKG